MKKIYILLGLILLNVLIYINKNSIDKLVNLEIKNDDFIITLFSTKDIKSLLINKKDLFILKNNDNKINQILNKEGITTLNNVIFENEYQTNIKSYNKYLINKKIMIDNFSIEKKENITILNYIDYSFCIYKNGNNKNLNNCDFIYFLEIDKVDFSDDVLIVFFDSSIDKDIIELYYDKWVDSYILNNTSFYTLKLSKNDYSVIEVPIN